MFITFKRPFSLLRLTPRDIWSWNLRWLLVVFWADCWIKYARCSQLQRPIVGQSSMHVALSCRHFLVQDRKDFGIGTRRETDGQGESNPFPIGGIWTALPSHNHKVCWDGASPQHPHAAAATMPRSMWGSLVYGFDGLGSWASCFY
jgi:hypothetical protein